MANLTLSLDDDLLSRAQLRAHEQNTTVNELVRKFLANFVGVNSSGGALDRFLELTQELDATSGNRGRTWKREELYE